MAMTSDQITTARLILADQGTSAVQSISIENAVGGTWTITYSGQTTTPLDYNAGANDAQNALCALSNVGVGNIVVQNVAPYIVYFAEDLGNVAQAMLTVDSSSLIGTGTIVTVSQVTAGGVTAFSDDELNSQYTLANDNFFLAMSYLFHVLWSNASKYNDYTAGQTEEKKSQITQHLKDLALEYERLSRADQQVQLASLVPIPPRLRAIPWTTGQPSIALSYGPPYGPSRWRRNGGGSWGW